MKKKIREIDVKKENPAPKEQFLFEMSETLMEVSRLPKVHHQLILLIEPDPHYKEILKRLLVFKGFDVEAFSEFDEKLIEKVPAEPVLVMAKKKFKHQNLFSCPFLEYQTPFDPTDLMEQVRNKKKKIAFQA